MEYILKKDGYVYLVKEHDVYGMHKTITNLGKDPNDPMWKEEVEEMKSKKKSTKKEDK